MSQQQQEVIITNIETVKEIVEYFVIAKYIPTVQMELTRFLGDFYERQRTLDEMTLILNEGKKTQGYMVGGDVGVFEIKQPTEQLVDNILRAFNNQLSEQERKDMIATITARRNQQKNANRKD